MHDTMMRSCRSTFWPVSHDFKRSLDPSHISHTKLDNTFYITGKTWMYWAEGRHQINYHLKCSRAWKKARCSVCLVTRVATNFPLSGTAQCAMSTCVNLVSNTTRDLSSPDVTHCLIKAACHKLNSFRQYLSILVSLMSLPNILQ